MRGLTNRLRIDGGQRERLAEVRKKDRRSRTTTLQKQSKQRRTNISHGSTDTPQDALISKNGPDAPKSETNAKSNTKNEYSLGKGIASGIAQKHLMDRLPHMPQIQRPGKEELLAAANGFWSRLKIRFKWFSIRSVRPFNADEIGAFFSWVLVGHVLWIFLGTTTFFSLAILAVNTVFAQGKCNLMVRGRL